MKSRRPFPEIKMRDLNRDPSRVLNRILTGERLIVTRHGVPVATLQPLNGLVVQPFEGRAYDVTGAAVGDPAEEADRLPDVQKDLLLTVRLDRLRVMFVTSLHPYSEVSNALEEMRVKGLIRRTERGLVLRGRGLMLREVLLERLGAPMSEWDDAVRWFKENGVGPVPAWAMELTRPMPSSG